MATMVATTAACKSYETTQTSETFHASKLADALKPNKLTKMAVPVKEYEVIFLRDGSVRDPKYKNNESDSVVVHYEAVLYAREWAEKYGENAIKFTPENTQIIDTDITPMRLMYIDVYIKYDASKAVVDSSLARTSFEGWVRIEKCEGNYGDSYYKMNGLFPNDRSRTVSIDRKSVV